MLEGSFAEGKMIVLLRKLGLDNVLAWVYQLLSGVGKVWYYRDYDLFGGMQV